MRISDWSSDVCSSDLDSARRGLFCQLVLIPLLRDHQVLCQVSGDDSYIIKLLPSLTIDESDRRWIVEAFDKVIGDCHHIGGAVWDLGSSLARPSSEERRVGKEGVSTCTSRGSPYH